MAVKKLTFGILFLISFALFSFQLDIINNLKELLFSFQLTLLIPVVLFILSIVISALFFVCFVTFANDFLYIIPTIVIASLIPSFFLGNYIGFVISGMVLFFFSVTYLSLHHKLENYLSFEPDKLLSSSVKSICFFTILSFCTGFYFFVDNDVRTNGFTLPDALIETSIKLIQGQEGGQENTESSELPQISAEQITLLKQHPELLSEYGLTPQMLDAISAPKSANAKKSNENSQIKELVSNQVNQVLKPYLQFIPAILTVLVFFSLTSISFLLNILVGPIIYILFFILEKLNFYHFEKEMREVKKLVL